VDQNALKILMIDNDDVFEFIFRETLRLAHIDCDIEYKTTANDALKYLEKSKSKDFPDMIFIDLNMPGKNGFEFLDDFAKKKLNSRGEKPFVAMISSSINEKDIKKAVSYPFVSDFLIKTIEMDYIKYLCENRYNQVAT